MNVAEYQEKTLNLLFEILKNYEIFQESTKFSTEYVIYSDAKERIFSIRRRAMRYSIDGKRAPDEYIFYIDNEKMDFSRDKMEKLYNATEQEFQKRENKRAAEEEKKKSEKQNGTLSFLGKFLPGRKDEMK